MKILIISLDLALGGFTKSLLYLLECLKGSPIEVDLLLILSPGGTSPAVTLPPNAKVVRFNLTDHFIRSQTVFHKKLASIVLSKRIIYKLKRIILNKTVYRAGGLPKAMAMKLYQTDDILKVKGIKGCLDLTEQYDCVISWCEQFPNYFLAEKVIAKKKIGWIHPDYVGAGFYADIDQRILDKLDYIAVVAESNKESLIKSIPQLAPKVRYIPNRVSVDLVRKMGDMPVNDIGDDEGSFKLVTVARLQNVSKALDRAVRIAARLKSMGLSFVWRIIGDGEDKAMLAKMIAEYDLQNHVILLGAKENPCPYVKKADLFVLQSHYEGKPVSVDEAMVLGTPVLVTDYTSAHEQLENGRCGFVVKNEESAIADKLSEIIRTPKTLEPIREYLRARNWADIEDCSEFMSLLRG